MLTQLKKNSKFLIIMILSNLFLFLGVKYSSSTLKILLPLNLSFKISEKIGVKIFDDFGVLLTNKAFIIPNPHNKREGFFMVEIPQEELSKITRIKADKFVATPFKEGMISREDF